MTLLLRLYFWLVGTPMPCADCEANRTIASRFIRQEMAKLPREGQIQCVLGPLDGEWIDDDGSEVVMLPHIVFDSAGNVVRLTQCEYRRAGDVMALVQRREAVRIE